MSARSLLSAPHVPGVNRFAVRLANVNGTGSSSMNNLLLKAVFRMGVPVSGKNVFPSNIQGMPTWYEIRVDEDGHTARAQDYDLVVAMNGESYAEDVASVAAGGYLLHDSTWPLPAGLLRGDVTVLDVPVTELVRDAFPPRERVLLLNTCCTGALVALLHLDVEVVSTLLDETFPRSAHLREANQQALRLGYDAALRRLECPLPFHVEGRGVPQGKVLLDGNTATALGCLYAGATVAAWYPITPSTSVMDGFAALCRAYRSQPGANDFLVLQAEDELAAIGMVVGAGWNGARAFTATSGPGLSLMGELLGLAYYTEIPAVVVDVQRAGPSTGMPTKTQQADLLAAAYASHGDTKHVLLFPADPAECFDFAVRAFDLAERFQTPVLVLTDLDIGMNDWVVDELTWDDSYVPDRGRVLGSDELAALPRFSRYADEDEDFVAARTLPGVDARGAYFVRGSGHDKHGAYSEDPEAYQQVVDRLARKHRAAADHLPAPVVERRPGAVAGIVSLGSGELAVREAAELLAAAGVPVDCMRVRGFPFPASVTAFLDQHELCFVVEQNRDGQLRSLLLLEAGGQPDRLRSVLSYGGQPLSAPVVAQGVLAGLEA